MRQEYANTLREMSQKGYEIISADFSRTRGKFWEELRFVYDLIPPHSKILDIGCGNGRFASELSDDSIDYTGIDFSKGLIEVARERYRARVHTSFSVGDALALTFADHTFNTVVSFAVLHHIPSRAYRVQFLREAGRVVKPGGLIILTAWNVWHSKPKTILKFILLKLIGKSAMDFGDAILDFGEKKNSRYVHALSMCEIRSLAKEAGLSIERLEKIRRPSGEENFFVMMRKTED